EPVMGEDEAAGMLREVPWRPDQLAGEVQGKAEPPVAEVEVQLFDVLGQGAFLRPAPDLGGQRLDKVFGQAERLANIAERAFGAITDDGRAERGMIAAIGLEDPLQDDLAPLVLEIDIYVGRLAPLLRYEALEQEVIALRVDRGDAKHIADTAVGGGAAALAENVLATGEADDRVHGQEIRRIAQRLNQA